MQTVNDFKTFLYYLGNQRKHYVAYLMEELFVSSITLVNLDQKNQFDWKSREVSFSKLQKEQRGEETVLNLKSFSFKYKKLFKFLC